MKTRLCHRIKVRRCPHFCPKRDGFTLIELLIVIAIIATLAGLLFPALVQARIRAQGAACLSNLKQMQIAWQMYAGDFNDILPPNAPFTQQFTPTNSGKNLSWCGNATEGWQAYDANTNSVYYTQSPLAPYLASQFHIYKCPGDTVPSANGQRLRSYSMNGQMGQYLLAQMGPNYVVNNNPGYKIYNQMNDLTCPGPGMTWTFSDEHPGSINDGFLVVDMTRNTWPDVPASSHAGGCGMSFADGHVELRKWLTPQIKVPVVKNDDVHNIEAGLNNPDYLWFTSHSTCLIGR